MPARVDTLDARLSGPVQPYNESRARAGRSAQASIQHGLRAPVRSATRGLPAGLSIYQAENRGVDRNLARKWLHGVDRFRESLARTRVGVQRRAGAWHRDDARCAGRDARTWQWFG